MEKTKEIRWFYPSDEFRNLNWFDTLEFDTYSESREHYLCLNPEGLEAKIRDRTLRLKQRVGTWSNNCLSENVWGHCLNFISWELDLDASDKTYQQILGDSDQHWWVVEKKRRAAQISQDGDRTIIRPASEELSYGCRVNHTKLEVCGSSWDTVCFEFYGTKCISLDQSLVQEIMGEFDYTLKHSMGYAKFLDEMVDKQRTSLYADDHVLPAPGELINT